MTLLEEALTNRPFPQLHLKSEDGFASYLRKRSLEVGTKGIRSFVEAGIIEELTDNSATFHPFQIWPIFNLLRSMESSLHTGISFHGLDPEGLKHYIDINWPHHVEHLVNFPKSEELAAFNCRILPLLLWIESYFLPVVRGPRASMVTLTNTDSIEWGKWRASTNIGAWLFNHSITVEQLSKWREHLLSCAYLCDPTPDLYLLLRSMPFDKRDRFKGRLRLSYDLYEMAEITRLFLERITDRPERKEWAPTGEPNATWVERFYGSPPKFGSPEFLRPLTRYHGLDPAPRVRWLVEGETEEGFIVRYAEKLRVPIEEYATVASIGGDGSLKSKKHIAAESAFLVTAKDEQCFSALTFDDSSEVRKRIQSHIQRGLITSCFLINKADFELQNFEIDELVSVAISLASETPYPIKLSHEDLVREVGRQVVEKKKDFKKAFNDILHCNGEEFKLSKGMEWGKRLADFLSDRRDFESKACMYSEDALTKIEQQLLKVLRGSQPGIDFPHSVEMLDPKSLEIL